MKVYINERSIDRQASSFADAMDILSTLAKTVAKSKDIAYEKKAFRTKCFADREIMKNFSVRELLTQSVASKSPRDEIARKVILEILLRRPFTENRHVGMSDSIVNESNQCLKESCIDDAAESRSGSMLISATKNPLHTYATIDFVSSIYGRKTSINIWNEEMLEEVTWRFEHNPKHNPQPRREAGVDISEMDLTALQAQHVLSNGVKINTRVYGCLDGSWYQFHRHHDNKFHGFKVSLKENNADHMKALEVISSLDYLPCGQLFG